MEGIFNFDKTPLAPPGTKVLLYEDPTKRGTWAPHATDSYYIGPAQSHYRSYKFYIPKTRGYRIGKAAKLFPTYCNILQISDKDNIIIAAQDLTKAIQNYKGRNKQLTPKQNDALRQLATIFQHTTPHHEHTIDHALQRVNQNSTTDATEK